MGRFGRIVGIVLLGIVLLLAVGITFTIGWRPFLGPKARPLTDRKFEPTPERLARGQYIFNGCQGCHSPHDWTQHDVPILPGMKGAGMVLPIKELPGRIVAPNLTPDPETGAGTWTDDMFARAIREGIGHDGRALFPMMPYPHFRALPDEDLASVVAFIRTLPPVKNPLPKTEIIVPVKYLIRSVPEPLTAPVPPPDLSTPVKRGEYLVNITGCSDCHTPQRRGQPIKGLDFAGGFPLTGPWGHVTSVNITPDPSGIPYYDEQLFIQVMRTGYVKARPLSKIMPWWDFKDFTDEDLKAMFAFLKTLPPVKHRVDNAEPPTPCKVCGGVHGAGDKN
ncbi:MAG: c-type cytochrome [Terriglobia bacterium]